MTPRKCIHAVEVGEKSICRSTLPCSRRSQSFANVGIWCMNPMVETIDKDGYPRGCVQAKGKEMVK